jgi:transcriptional regulator with XRE-family HTH domain
MPHPTDTHVGQRLKDRRLAMGIKQSDVAKALGISFQQIQKYERGINRISASKLHEIALLLKVPTSHFFDGLDTSGPDPLALTSEEEARLLTLFRKTDQATRPAIMRILEKAAEAAA